MKKNKTCIKLATYLPVIILLVSQASCNPHRRKPNPAIPPRFVQQEPVFVHEADLQFLNSKKGLIAEIEAEVAETVNEHEQGLMYRKTLAQNRGMLFIFDEETRRNFWMKDTDLPLDIIFVNNNLMIIHIAPDCVPYSTEGIPSFEYARYVVEVNAGYCKLHNIDVGDYIQFKKLNE